jgi:hypothetical protein
MSMAEPVTIPIEELLRTWNAKGVVGSSHLPPSPFTLFPLPLLPLSPFPLFRINP